MDALRNKYYRLLKSVQFEFKRYLFDHIRWQDRLIIIKGQRGVGKTTLLLQYIQEHVKDLTKSLYISLDDLYFASNSLSDLVEEFIQLGGTTLFIDEVHRYPSWSTELKNIYDFYPELKIVATGSSTLAIHEGMADLSRRASIYDLQTLSMREFLCIHKKVEIASFSLEELMEHHEQIALDSNRSIKPLACFREFLRYGSYPFGSAEDPLFHEKLKTVIHLIIDNDIPAVENITYETRIKIKKLLYLLSTAVPFKPNISQLSQKVGTSRDMLLKYLHVLGRSGILNLLSHDGTGNSILQKPEKIYMNNPNLMYALNEGVDMGTLRETFFLNQLSTLHQLTYPKKGDFLINDRYLFEVGGKNKKTRQIANHPYQEAYLAIDDIEYGSKHKIPLWLFGFLY